MTDVFPEIFANLGYLLLLINTFLSYRKWKKYKVKAMMVFTLYSFLMLVVQISSKVLFLLNTNNIFLSHFYFILQFVTLSYFYYILLKNRLQQKVILFFTVIASLALIIEYSVSPKTFFTFNLLEIFITSLPIIVYATFHLYNLLNESKKFYYISLGILIYLFGSTVIFLTGNLFLALDSNYLFRLVWSFNVYLYVMYQLFILKDLLIKENGTTL